MSMNSISLVYPTCVDNMFVQKTADLDAGSNMNYNSLSMYTYLD